MSGVLRFGKGHSKPKGSGGWLSGAGRAGPRRLAIMAASGTALAGLMAVVAFGGHSMPTVSQDARMKQVDALPGGLNSTPEQDALALRADRQRAEAALGHGTSFTPPMAPSVPVVGAPPKVEQAARPTDTPPAAATPAPQPRFVGRPVRSPEAVRVVVPTEVPAGPIITTPTPVAQVIPVQAVVDPKQTEAYNKQIGELFNQWGNHFPRTDVVMPPTERNDDPPLATQDSSTPAPSRTRGAAATPVVSRSPDDLSARSGGQVLIPAGRGIYAHPVLALSSDQSSPVVMQADSGPIAGDRMIGSFAMQDDRLVIHISSIVHNGQQISADGVVIAPDTMEAGVATGVDQHYLARFVLPAAAAFVQGLGTALATTSNTVAVLSPLGGATTSTNLNFHQQLGVAAGVAGAQVGSTLNQSAPKGTTVTLDANVAVGVMFLSNVTARQGD